MSEKSPMENNDNQVSYLPSKNTETGNLNWEKIDLLKGELKQIFESIDGTLDKIKAMTEIALERGFEISPEGQKRMNEELKKFEPFQDKYMKDLYNMISDLGNVNTIAFQEGLLVTAPELIKKLEEIKSRK